jgi:hypothetical protein
MNTRSTLLLISLFLFSLQGCCTNAVKNIGIETESVQRCEKVCVGTDGSIAVLVYSRFHKDGPLDEYKYSNRIILGSPTVIKRSISDNSVRDKGTLLVNVDIVESDLDGWHMLPSLLEKHDTYINYLPKSLQNNFTSCNPCAFKYNIDNKYENIFLKHFSFYKNGVHSDVIQRNNVWHYPSQLLLIPAFAFDLVTAPIQLIIIGGMTKQ